MPDLAGILLCPNGVARKECPVRPSPKLTEGPGMFALETGKRLPDLMASMNRSLNVTIQRESGATTEKQKKLATHMMHSHDTASKYYDRSDRVHRITSLHMTQAMRGLRKAAATETGQDSGVCGKSARSISRTIRNLALLTKPLHGKGASESSSSVDIR